MVPDLTELIAAVNELNNSNDELSEEVANLREEITKYIPREEAEEKANKVATLGGIVGTALLVLGLLVFGFVLYVQEQAHMQCQDSRQALREVITTAVADRQPLATSTPETIQAIQEQNERVIRPLREKLLALEGTQPNKC